MKNRDVFAKDPLELRLVNNGVAEVVDASTKEQLDTLRYELETFVCDKQYSRGLERILDTYLACLGKEEQRPVWVSGFFGSGKSHLVKMLRALWADFTFPDGASARGLSHLSPNVRTSLKELTTQGKRLGGLHACSGTLGSGASGSIRLAVLAIVFRSAGLPESYPAAQFVMFLRRHGILEAVRAEVENEGKDFAKELRDLYVSPVLARALLKADRSFAPDEAKAKVLLNQQFPKREDISEDELIAAIHSALDVNGSLPLTLLALDEVQQWVGEDVQRSYQVNVLAECCAKKFGSRLLLVATGQTALSGTPALQRLQDRFMIKIELSDTDVETVIRSIVLAKRPDRTKAVEDALGASSGEIARHLHGTKLASVPEDQEILATDYPLLPVRRRFWERVLRAVDRAGTSGQLRTQLRIVHEAVRGTAERPLGTVVPADFVYDQTCTELVQTGVLLREIHDRIATLATDPTDGRLKARLAALIFLIGRLPREGQFDSGVRATAEALADLLVENLHSDGPELRSRIPGVLDSMVAAGHLMKLGDEYRLQTKEGSAWDGEFRERYGKILADDHRISSLRQEALQAAFGEAVSNAPILQGKSKPKRALDFSFGLEAPRGGTGIPIWVRDGWNEDEKSVVSDIQGLGTSKPLVVVFLPRRSPDELKRALAAAAAAKETLQVKGMPTTDEGREARKGMETLEARHLHERNQLISLVLRGAQIYLAGIPAPRDPEDLADGIRKAATEALARIYPQFHDGDDPRWEQVFDRAKTGAPDPLQPLGFKGQTETHPVTAAVYSEVGGGKKGAEIRRKFTSPPFGWPQDTVDGALLALVAAERLRATVQGQNAGLTLDRTKIGIAEFRPEHPVLTTAQKIAIRKLYTDAGLNGVPGQEPQTASQLLAELQRLGQAAGGDPPLPARPPLAPIAELNALSGNELLFALHEKKDELTSWAKDWKSREEEIKKRRPAWDRLLKLLEHAKGLPVADEVRPQVEAISTQRRLLESPDPVPALTSRLSEALRAELNRLVRSCQERHSAEERDLQSKEAWQKLDEALHGQLSATHGLQPFSEPQIGTTDQLLTALNARSLENWQSAFHAIPSRFTAALTEASKLLEPKAVPVSLPGATLKTEADLEQWLDTVRQRVSAKLKEGPVIV